MAALGLTDIKFYFTENRAGVDEVLRGPNGLVVRHFLERAVLVKEAAERQIKTRAKYATGALASSLFVRLLQTPEGPTFTIGSNSPHALFVHEGTKPHVIVPRTATVLRWTGSDGGAVFSNIVHHPGTSANRFLTDNLPIAVGRGSLAAAAVERTSTGGLFFVRGRF